MNDVCELRQLTDAELDIVGGGDHHHRGNTTNNVIVNVDVGQIGNQVAGTQNNYLSAVGNIFNHPDF
jgi:hypothetical protein